jgi:hypothetical protein
MWVKTRAARNARPVWVEPMQLGSPYPTMSTRKTLLTTNGNHYPSLARRHLPHHR